MNKRLCERCGRDFSNRDHWYRKDPFSQEKLLLCSICYVAAWNLKNQENYLASHSASSAVYYAKNKEKIQKHQKEYYQKNKIRINRHRRDRNRVNISARLAGVLRSRLVGILRGEAKPASAIKMLGCSVDFLKQYLEAKFLPNMTWDNYGRGSYCWNIDHIKPLASFNLTELEQFRQASHYTNLQPMWSVDNIRKSDNVK